MTTVAYGGGGGGSYINTWTDVNTSLPTTSPYLTTTVPLVTTTIGPIDGALYGSTLIKPKGIDKLTPAEGELLLRAHRFIPMEHGPYCLFCFALDIYRDQRAHEFVISEE